jgi:glycosyltransferase involved in cell wall biosynthesis
MNGMRVVLISRRFWPLTGGAERATANLACGLFAAGARPSVVTARFDAQWPGEVAWREMPVYRLPFPHRFGWGMTRYMMALSRWLRQHRSMIDVVCVSRLAHEAHAAVGALAGTSIPVVLRAEAAHAPDEVTGKRGGGFGRRLGRYQQADAIVAASAEARHRLLAAGFDPGRVHAIPNGVACDGARTADRRHAARRVLAAANEDLRVPLNVPVAICLGQLTADNAFDQVVRAWPQVARRWPFARLWIIGDGEERENLYRQIRHADLIGRVLLPGAFDEVDDLLQAADLMVLPNSSGKEPLALLEALAAELPVLASHSPGHQELVVHGVTGRLYPAGNADQLASAILDAFDDQDAGKVDGRCRSATVVRGPRHQ